MRYVSSETMRRLDERAIKEYGIPSILLMENAGSACAREALKMRPRNVLVLSGKGNNGGDGFVADRHLWCQGVPVSVLFFQHPNKMKADPQDRKSTRLNSSHSSISYAVFCLKKKSTTSIGVRDSSLLAQAALSHRALKNL